MSGNGDRSGIETTATGAAGETPDAPGEPAGGAEVPGSTVDAPVPADAAPRPGGGRGLAGKSVRDMVLSMAVLLLGVFFVYLFVPNDPSQDPVRPVEYRVEANTASRAAPYELLTPRDLPEEWRATSVRYRAADEHGAVWRLGFMDPENEYAALAQTDTVGGEEDAPFVVDLTRGARETGETVRIGDREWAWMTGDRYDALVSTGPDGTVVVTGTAPRERLEFFAGSLEPWEIADPSAGN
ncbi:DUF4245 domain-containing protein [Streptomyces sp. ST2-7A]|uniref:DUF4245 domain-containing protein n=1 Tax=Streptomyces sp. ST2-7A TaxID=2907214 RepID=UPI001F36C8D0|nr:DUF4245 domain-containing protein [Streptomyces sp. ST2-7A]MCE7082126.1 DUF4245 family protein [Streptomyces sp. ST2-7A]